MNDDDDDSSGGEDIVLVLSESNVSEEILIENIYMTSKGNEKKALIDSACPTTLAGMPWVVDFVEKNGGT